MDNRAPTNSFLEIEAASREAATHPHSRYPDPTPAQLAAGNYRLGRFRYQGLPLAIENARGTTRKGVDADGKAWETRLAAHYGYVVGTRGNDGDGVDVFFGGVPESEDVWVINQHIGGAFDEHKAMLGFIDADGARSAYQHSYTLGWKGLKTMVPMHVSQFKWWLRHGDKTKPISATDLPAMGMERAMDTARAAIGRNIWTGDVPSAGMARVFYGLQVADAADGLMLDSATMEELCQGFEVITLDAVVVLVGKLQPRMQAMERIMNAVDPSLKVVDLQLSDPLRKAGAVHVAVRWELSDGQSVTAWFHNPDTTPAKLTPADELVSWKWLLNKRDITIVVAPEHGQEINVRDIARRVMKLAAKNSAAFQKANAGREERKALLKKVADEITAKEATLAGLNRKIEAAELERDNKMVADRQATARLIRSHLEAMAKLEAQIEEAKANRLGVDVYGTGLTLETLMNDYDKVADDIRDLRGEEKQGLTSYPQWKALRDAEEFRAKAEALDPAKSEDYNVIRQDQRLQEYFQDQLDAMFQGRIIAVRNSLRALGWDGEDMGTLSRNGARLILKIEQIGAGSNVVGVAYAVAGNLKSTATYGEDGVRDDLSATPEELAALIDGDVPREEPVAVAEGASDPVSDPQAVVTVPISLSGTELGSFDDTPEGVKSLRDAAKAYLMAMRGEMVDCPILGKPVEIRTRGVKETIHFSANPLKLKLIPAIKTLIATAKDKSWEDNVKPETKPYVSGYFTLPGTVEVGATTVSARVLIEQDTNGLLHYDLVIDAEKKTALDCSGAVSVPGRSPDHKSGLSGQESVANGDASVNPLLDSTHAMVLNLFIGEADQEDEILVDVPDEFAHATPEFLEFLASMAAEGDLEVSNTAKKMDAAAVENGAAIHWEVGVSMMDSVGLAVEVLRQARETAQNNAPIAQAAGDGEQAALDLEVAASAGEAIEALSAATVGEPGAVLDAVPDSMDMFSAFDPEMAVGIIRRDGVKVGRCEIAGDGKAMVTVGDSNTQRVRFVSGVTAMWSDDDAAHMVVALLTVPQAEPEVVDVAQQAGFRKINNNTWAYAENDSQGRRLRFNIVQAHDGACRLRYSAAFPGTTITGTPSQAVGGVFSDLEEAVNAFREKFIELAGAAPTGSAVEQPAAPATVEPTAEPVASEEPVPVAIAESVAEPASELTMTDAIPAMQFLRSFMSQSQLSTIANGMRSEEGQWFIRRVIDLAAFIKAMPKTYEQDGKGMEATAYLHYFRGGADWYITERDMEDDQLQAFGWADLGLGGGELGYISIAELIGLSVELDLHFEPKTLSQLVKPSGSDASVDPVSDAEAAIPMDLMRIEAVAKKVPGMQWRNPLPGQLLNGLAAFPNGDEGKSAANDAYQTLALSMAAFVIQGGGSRRESSGIEYFTFGGVEVAVSMDSGGGYGGATIGITVAQAAVGEPASPNPVVDAEPKAGEVVKDGGRNIDLGFLQAVAAGQVSKDDMLADDFSDRLESAFTRHPDDADITAAFTAAVSAFEAAMLNATANL